MYNIPLVMTHCSA